MPAIPEGFQEATWVFQVAGKSNDITWSHGLSYQGVVEKTSSEMAEEIYGFSIASGRPYLASFMNTDWTFIGVAVTKMLSSGPDPGQFFDPQQGEASGESVPCNGALLVRKNTALGGRRNRGRFYAPMCRPTEDNVSAAGVIGGAQVTSLQTTFSNLIADLVSGDYLPELFHTESPFTPTLVTSWTVQPILATQRRRMRS